MEVPESLIERSSLTRRQLESLLGYLRVSSGELKLKDAANLLSQGRTKGRGEGPLTIGSYYRTVKQAKENVRESLTTVVVGLWLGVISVQDTRRLFDAVGQGGRELSDEEARRFAEVVRALIDRIVA